MRRALAVMVHALFLISCARTEPHEVWLIVRAGAEDGVKLEAARVVPETALVERHVERARVALRVRVTSERLVVNAPGACPLSVSTRDAAPNGVLEREAVPLFDFGPPARTVGLEQHFELRALPRCPEANAARVEFRVTGGAPLAAVTTSADGPVFSARTAGLAAFEPGGTPRLVPISAAKRGATELALRETLPDGAVIERPLEVAAVARSSGLSNVALGHTLVLAGDALALSERPAGSSAALRRAGAAFELTPDARGAYTVSDARGRTLVLDAARYDETPLDCARAECHSAVGASARENPMLRVLADDLGGRHALATPACALACHATGEPGTPDGGFSDVLAAFASGSELPARFEALPRALRRLGGVGCLACHGPGSLPAESGRWALLRSDVCAVCHDAPPRYGHVAALAESAMARADADARTRKDASCARCHTTWGALGRPAPPPETPPSGVACATCHAVHAHGASERPSARGLLRDVPLPPAFADVSAARGPSRVCIACHAPGAERPAASAAALWAGRGGVDPETGAPLEGAAPHARDARGCLGCHDAGPKSLALGAGHAFHVGAVACERCHAEPPRRDLALAERARTLVRELSPESAQLGSASEPLHANAPVHASATRGSLSPEREHALRDALLVLEDPAADAHNPAYAALLLERAEPFARAKLTASATAGALARATP